MSRRDDTLSRLVISKGHGIYRLSGTHSQAWHNRKAFVRAEKKKEGGEYFLDYVFKESSPKKKKKVFNAEESFYSSKRKLSPSVFSIPFFFTPVPPSVENKRCQPSSSSACNAITRKVPLNPP